MAKALQVSIPRPNFQVVNVTIVGTSPIIFHAWSQKAIRMIEEKQQKKATASKKKEARNPQEEYEASFYYTKDKRVAFPSLAIRQCFINAARVLNDVPMTLIRATVFVLPFEERLVPLIYKEEDKEMRTDMVTIGMGTADVRYRGQLKNWKMTFPVQFNADIFSLEQVMNLIQTAGFSVGLGEWRPEKGGDFGTFKLE